MTSRSDVKPVTIVLGEADGEFASALSEAMSGRDRARLTDRPAVSGEGLYEHTCADCGQPFRSGRQRACLCEPCELRDAAKYTYWPDVVYRYSWLRGPK